MLKTKKGFTLIELIVVAGVMATLAIIAIPLVMSIVKKAKTASDKRSIDAYGRAIELAIAGYLLDNGHFPTDISQLTIEYSGKEVVCSQTQLHSDSSVYLADCRVGGNLVDGYTYGIDTSPSYQTYSIGDEVTYNNVDYYVIEDSSKSEENVTLLKKEPLTAAEVTEYGVGHINRHTSLPAGTVSNVNGYGAVVYYSGENCEMYNTRYTQKSNSGSCTNDYLLSEIKYIVDAWSQSQVPSGLVEARLITFEELTENLGFEFQQVDPTSQGYKYTANTPNWVYSSSYWYWTMTPLADSSSSVYYVKKYGYIDRMHVFATHVNSEYEADRNNYGVVRPVITISKSVLSS